MNRREGFWRDSKESQLPMPVMQPEEWPGRATFLNKLDIVQGRGTTEKIGFRGHSMCRICKQMNGSRTYIADGWEWPEGYMHYIEEHNVRPSLAFQEYVLQKEVV